MNLREDKHWSYGVFSTLPSALGQRPYLSISPVQTDKTKEALADWSRNTARSRKGVHLGGRA